MAPKFPLPQGCWCCALPVNGMGVFHPPSLERSFLRLPICPWPPAPDHTWLDCSAKGQLGQMQLEAAGLWFPPPPSSCMAPTTAKCFAGKVLILESLTISDLCGTHWERLHAKRLTSEVLGWELLLLSALRRLLIVRGSKLGALLVVQLCGRGDEEKTPSAPSP